MIIACDGIATGTELLAIADAVMGTLASLLVGVEDDAEAVNVSVRVSVTTWPPDVVRTCSGFMQIV